jgi:hypothetical protein
MRRSPAFIALLLVVVASACTSSGDDSAPDSTADVAPSSVPAGTVETTPRTTELEEQPTSTDFDRALPEGEEPEVLGPLGETEVEIETENGVIQIGVAEVPASVASTFPLPEDLTVQIASEDGDASGFSGVSQLLFDELIDFYEVSLAEAGYEVERSQFVADVVAVFDFTGPDGSGQVAISSAPGGGRSVLVTFVS